MLSGMLLIVLLGAHITLARPSGVTQTAYVNRTTCNGRTYTYEELGGYGFLPSDARDSLGDTIGGIGSAIAFESRSWKKSANGHYEGVVYTLPDRGWNTEGTLNVQSRIQKFRITFRPNPSASLKRPSKPNVQLKYLETILLTGPDGTPCTGLDADPFGSLSYPGFPDLPAATYSGNGFGGKGPGGKRIALDTEGLVLNEDGSFWISDEYGPYVYRFDKKGKMVAAIRPPEALVPRRNGTTSFSANSPPVYDRNRTITPRDPRSGRANNQGFEGLTVTGDGKSLYVLLQSAATQEGGPSRKTNLHARLVKYDVSGNRTTYAAEYVVPLPQFNDPTEKPEDNPRTAAQSEVLHVIDGQFFVLARDSGFGRGQDESESVYRHVDVFDISSATDLKSPGYDAANGSIASKEGVLRAGIVPATYCSFLDYNVNSQLNRFGLHNGGPQDETLLNEKWESLALLPVDGEDGKDDEYFLFSFADNDFITQNGFLNGGQFRYNDSSGFNLDTQVLVFKVKLPKNSRPSSQPRGNQEQACQEKGKN